MNLGSDGLSFDDSSLEDSLVVPFFTSNRTIRILVGGKREALRQFAVAASEFQRTSDDESTIIARVADLASGLGLTIGDIFAAAPPAYVRFDTAELIRQASKSPTAEQAWRRIKAILTSASDEELSALMVPETLARVRPIVQSVLADLDEHRALAEADIRKELDPTYCYLLLS